MYKIYLSPSANSCIVSWSDAFSTAFQIRIVLSQLAVTNVELEITGLKAKLTIGPSCPDKT